MQQNSVFVPLVKKDNIVAWLFAIAIGAFGLLGSVGTVIVATLSIWGLVLYATGNIELVVPNFLRRWAAMILIFVSVSLSVATYNYFSEYQFGNMFSRLAFLEFLPLVMLIGQIKKEKLLQTVERVACVTTFLILIVAIGERLFFQDRVSVGAGNSGPFSVSMAVCYTICLFAFARTKNSIYLGAALAAAVCILLSGMRNMMPIIIITPIIAIIFSRLIANQAVSRKTQFVFVLTVILLLIAAITLALPRFDALITSYEKINELRNFDSSLGHRIIMWDYALERIPDSPWLGFGVPETTKALSEFSQHEYGLSISYTHLHNFILNALMVGGIVELSALMLLICAPFFALFSKKLNHQNMYLIYARLFMLTITFIYLATGTINIMFNHDVMDHLYLISIALVARLAIPD